jgi:hypothetical protein
MGTFGRFQGMSRSRSDRAAERAEPRLHAAGAGEGVFINAWFAGIELVVLA